MVTLPYKNIISMLSLFPSLLSWSQVAPLLDRLCLGAVLLWWAYRLYHNGSAPTGMKLVGLIEVVIAIFLVIGLWTQAAVLAAVIDLLIRIGGRIRNKSFLTNGINYYLVLLVLAVSLMLSGAGFLAFDLPL
jgi:uncharacterized membrane protein YphA (DoxX/SURF4 family)